MTSLKEQLKTYGMNRMGFKECSVQDLRQALFKRAKLIIEKNEWDENHSEVLCLSESIDNLLDTWIRQGILSDDRYMKMMVRSLVNRKQGFRVIQMKLKLKGIFLDQNAYQNILVELGFGDSKLLDFEMMKAFLQRKYPNYFKDKKEQSRAFAALVRKGYDFDQIKKILKTEME